MRFGVNYTPSQGWFHSWLDLDHAAVARDFAQIAGLGEQHKDQVRRDYQARMDNLTGTRYQAQLGKAAGTQNMISGIGSSLGQLAMLYGMGSGSGGGLANFAGGK